MRKFLPTLLYLVDFVYLAIAVAFGIVLFGYVCMLGIDSKRFADAIAQNPYFFLDFSKYYAFTKLTFSPDAAQLFSPELQMKTVQSVIAPAPLKLFFWSEYPPFLGILFAPLSLVPVGVAYVIYLTVSAGSACAAVFYLARKYGNQSLISSAGLAAAMFASVNALWATMLGQLNWLMVTCIAILYIALSQGRWIVAGVSLALMSLKPHYAVFYNSPFANRRGWKSIALFVVCELILAVAAGFVVGWDNVLGYPGIVLHTHAAGTLGNTQLPGFQEDEQFEVGLRRLMTLVFGTGPLSVGLLIMFATMIWLAWMWWKLDDERVRPWAMAATIFAFLLTNPHCHLHDCLPTAVAAAITMPTVSLRGMQAIPDRLHRIWCHLMYFYPIFAWAGFLLLFKQSAFRSIYFLAANLVFFGIAIAMMRRSRSN